MTQRILPYILALVVFTLPAFAQNTVTTRTTIFTDRSPSLPVYAFDETAADALNTGYPLDADSHTIIDLAPASGATYTKHTYTRVETDKPYHQTRTVTTTRTSGPTVIYRDGADVDATIMTQPVTGDAEHDHIPADTSNSPNTNLQK